MLHSYLSLLHLSIYVLNVIYVIQNYLFIYLFIFYLLIQLSIYVTFGSFHAKWTGGPTCTISEFHETLSKCLHI